MHVFLIAENRVIELVDIRRGAVLDETGVIAKTFHSVREKPGQLECRATELPALEHGVHTKDVPDEVLDRIGSVDITVRDYASNRDAITSIAVITFAYKLANNTQKAQFGAKDILLLKVLAKNEKLRREGKGHSHNRIWDAPLFELITGEVGERLRAMRTMNSPI